MNRDVRDRLVVLQEQKDKKEDEKQVRKEEMVKKQQKNFTDAVIKYFGNKP
jgi:hypothetical protein